MTNTTLTPLQIANYVRIYGKPIKYRTGYCALSQSQTQQLQRDTEQPRTLYHNLHKSNPHVCKRWGDM